MTKTRIDQLVRDYKDVVTGQPWFGTGLSKTMDEIPHSAINHKTETMSHSIGELVIHIINWRNYAIQKIKGNKEFDIETNSDMDWLSLENISEAHWVTLLDILDQSFNELISELENMSDGGLDEGVPGKKFTFVYLIRGIIQHDIYHLGQIRYVFAMTSKN